ncbi:DUF6491 family protein [Marinimicrobium sp. ARAG 43.8]|uniref:DUF6491 family protein n=1 Tax=Marinimicrobium sp. ARAG 43.8 TaxID=3418719 RepID=UPI003CE8C101
MRILITPVVTRARSTALMAALVTLAGCATQEGPSFYSVLQETSEQNGRACIRHSDIRGYGVLDRDVISIDGRRHYYLATVLPGCNALGVSPAALFEQRFNEVCGGGQHRLYTGGDHCTIRQIFEFNSREEAFAAHEQALKAYHQDRERLEETAEQN